MRHLIGVILAIAMAAAVFFAASWGYLKLLIGPAKDGVLPAGGGSLIHDHAVLEGFGVLLAVGLLAGILMVLPVISPLASGLPGLALLAWTGLYLFSVRRAVQYIPLKSQSYGAGFEALLFDGVLALAGLAMIIPLFVPSRWRSRAAGPEPYEAAPASAAYPDLAATQTVADGSGSWPTGPRPGRNPGWSPGTRRRPGVPRNPGVRPARAPPTTADRAPRGYRREVRRARAQAAWNCSASVEPARATVSALGEIADVTRSK